MTVIAQDVFVMAMNLMDEESEDGTFDGYPDEYKTKSWPILTLLQAELVDINTTLAAVTDPTTVLQLDDRTCLTTLPYGLAAHLLLTDDQPKASFFNARYDELKASVPSSITMVQSVYKINPCEDTPTTPDPPVEDDSADVIDGGEW